ncbi:hypothetical protein [Mangrovicoccus sp. HB161399]|uniref:hypothetical protein n=1 Tax=Mangrovicoccus sp. HB161399 TaxID=2720392 RepID=UPI001555D380|nr:hypothetical protein [Mangrovicoccus sp. HB161399]
MERTVIHGAAGLVEVSCRTGLAPVRVELSSEHDEGTRTRDAVLAALDWVAAHDVRNWLADVSRRSRALTAADSTWVSGPEFRSAVPASPPQKFVLLPPLPGTGRGTALVAPREANAQSEFPSRVSARVCGSLAEAEAFFRA